MSRPPHSSERGPDLPQPEHRHKGRNITKADILFYRLAEIDLAVKDYSPRPWLIRQTLGRMLIRRETAAYRAVGALTGVPELVGRRGRFALATRWIDARPLAEAERGSIGPEVFDRLERIVASLHARGVALADLHHRDVLLAGDGSVHVVDLATACVLGDSPGPLRRAIFERCREADLVAVARMRARYGGLDPQQAVAGVGSRAVARHRRRRALKRLWNRLRGKPGASTGKPS